MFEGLFNSSENNLRIDRQMQQTKGQTALLEVTVTALRDVLNADRVLIYRFEEDNRSRAIAEAIQAGWTSLLNQSLPINLFVTTRCWRRTTLAGQPN